MTATNTTPEPPKSAGEPLGNSASSGDRIPARDSQFLQQNPHLQDLQDPYLQGPYLFDDPLGPLDGDLEGDLDVNLDGSLDGVPKTARIPHPSAFDQQHPPAQSVIDSCVHCGFCLSTCPSYRVLGTEMDSPRGRIYLMDAIANGEAALDETTASHFDSCLGCLACTSVCPSQVGYDKLLADMRPQLERNVPRNWRDRLIRTLVFNLFPYPRRLQAVMPGLWLYQKLGLQQVVRQTGWLKKLSPQLAAMDAVLPNLPAKGLNPIAPRQIPAQGKRRYRVGMLLGCVQRSVLPQVNEATMGVLSALGCEVIIPPDQGCCGALPAHPGQENQAQDIAKAMIRAFDGVQQDKQLDAIIINAAGCGHTLKEYGGILRDDPEWQSRGAAFSAQVRDIHEFLAEVVTAGNFDGELRAIAPEPLTVVYQDACHLLHGQKISTPPRQLLAKIPGVELREPMDASLCCGSAGVFNLLQPEIAEELGEQKVDNLLATGAQVIASPNPGCTLQIQKHLRERDQDHPDAVLGKVPVYHPIQLLDYSLRGEAIAIQSSEG
ncbi:MAG: (Fe-S)-binding protein [Cyanophyceae cyanobacterium]